MKTPMKKRLAIFCCCWFPILMLCFYLMATGRVTLSIYNFAVDSKGMLYIGTEHGIHIYDDQKKVGFINPHTSRSYAFTVSDENTIMLSTASTVYSMDLNGNVIQTQEDPGASIYNQLQYNKKHFKAVSGDEFQMTQTWGRTKIIKNHSDVVFQISILSVIVKGLLILAGISIFVFLVRECIIFGKNRGSSLP